MILDEQLIPKAKAGDEAAYSEIFERYKNMVRKTAGKFYIAGGDREDLIQEGMIGLFQAVRDFDPEREAAFASFARLCVERQILSAIRKASSRKNAPLNDSVPIPEGGEPALGNAMADPEEILISEETARSLETELEESLSPFEKKVFRILLLGKGYVEIAKELAVAPKSVDNALQRIKKKMKTIQR